jgi:polyvinyl alcohol dehydrogenase (cytochrome)
MRRALPALAAAAALLAAPAAASAACDAPASPAGEWPSYGRDLANSRVQPDEHAIGKDNAASLRPAFVYRTPGPINATPVVDGGCVFVASQGAGAQEARVAAIDAGTGQEVWAWQSTVGTPSFGGPAVSTPALSGNLVITPINKNAAPFLVANDRSTGAEVWRRKLDDQANSGVNASAVAYDGMVVAGFFGNADAGSHERGGFVIVDAATGQIVKKTYAIPDADFAAGYEGAGIWSTPAIDTSTGYAYAGTSNPHNPHREHARSNALIKIDLNRGSPTFGEIVASYKGVGDTVVPGASQQPVCETKPDVYYAYSFSATCLAADLDFGSSPNLFAVDGQKRIGDLQKSGVYHVVDAGTMAGVSRTPVGAACFACNAASAAFDSGHAYVAGGPPGELVAIDGANGVPAWAAPIAGGFTYNPVSVANGVVWTQDSQGFLDAYDQRTGAVLVKRNMQGDTGASVRQTTTSGGIAIARNTLYTAAASYLIAYRPA